MGADAKHCIQECRRRHYPHVWTWPEGLRRGRWLVEQVNVLNIHFNGKDTCSHTHYQQHFADVQMLFRYDGHSHVQDSRCATSCYNHYGALRPAYAPWQAGQLKVLICGLSGLGVSCYGCSPAIRPDTLPGGSSTHYNLGKTLTHEIGHTLRLPHTFANGCAAPGDGFADTNFEASSHFGCASRTTCGSLDPVHNYMDYSYDECMCSFTHEQRAKMHETVQLQHASFLSKVATQGPCSCCNPNKCCPGGCCPCNGASNADFAKKYDDLLANPSCLAERLTAIGKNPSRYTQVPALGGQCCTQECFQVPQSEWNTRWPQLPYMKLDFSPCS